jgi:hypothetical protein
MWLVFMGLGGVFVAAVAFCMGRLFLRYAPPLPMLQVAELLLIRALSRMDDRHCDARRERQLLERRIQPFIDLLVQRFPPAGT